jgi:hypothetical protein
MVPPRLAATIYLHREKTMTDRVRGLAEWGLAADILRSI